MNECRIQRRISYFCFVSCLFPKGERACMKKIFSFFILLILVNLAAVAQDEQLIGSYMIVPNISNPGFVGAKKTINAVFLNRTQWAGFGDGDPVTSVFSIEAPVSVMDKKCGLGVAMTSDAYGYYDMVNVDFGFAYHHDLSIGKISGGITIGFKSYALSTDWDDITEDEEYFSSYSGDPYIPTGSEVNDILLRLGAGVYYETSKYYLGFSAANLNQPTASYLDDEDEIAYDYMCLVLYLQGGYNIELPDPLFELQPTFMLRTDLAAIAVNWNATMYYKEKYWFGAGLQTSFINISALSIMGGLELVSGLNLGYMMDVNVGATSYLGLTSHEVIVTYSFNIETKRNQKYKSIRYL